MRVFLIGASGAIGYSLFKYLKKKKNLYVRGTYNENYKKGLIKFNLNKDKIKKTFKKLKESDTFLILAAKTNNNWVFKNYSKARKININSTINLISDLKSLNCNILYFSSAEIFDGKKGFYTEKDFGNPVSKYGKTKNFIEKYLLNKKYSNYSIVRTGGNISLDTNYKCMISQTYTSLQKNYPKMAKDNLFTITHEDDFNRGVYKLLCYLKDKIKLNQKIFHIVSDTILSRVKFAKLIIKNSKKIKNVKFKTVKFNQIIYNEKRAAKNNLISKHTRKILKIKFRKPEEIIKQKIRLLEKNEE